MIPKLPNEVIGQILMRCSARTARQARLVSKAWAQEAEPRIYHKVVVNGHLYDFVELLRKRKCRALLVKELVMYSGGWQLGGLTEIIGDLVNLERLQYNCRGPISELYDRKLGQDVLRVTINIESPTELGIFLKETFDSSRKIHLEMETDIQSLAKLEPGILDCTTSLGLCLETVGYCSERDIMMATKHIQHMKQLYLHIPWACYDIRDFLAGISGDNVEHLSLSSGSSPLVLPAWNTSKTSRLIEYIVPAVFDDYQNVSDSPTKRCPRRLFASYGGRGHLRIKSNVRYPTLFHKELMRQAIDPGVFDSVIFEGKPL